MTKAQLAILPLADGRRAERRVVNLAARLRDPGATLMDVEVMNLSTAGFMAQGKMHVETGTYIWLKLSGLEPQNCRVIWVEGDKAGFEFSAPLHPATVELLALASGKSRPKPQRRFGH